MSVFFPSSSGEERRRARLPILTISKSHGLAHDYKSASQTPLAAASGFERVRRMSVNTAKEQENLWGARALDFANASEPAWRDVYLAVLDQARVRKGIRHLDIGCGAGGALVLARERGAHVSGFDASE